MTNRIFPLPKHPRPRGQSLVFMALIIVGVLVFAGLALDGGRIYMQRRSMQNASDAGALAGALARLSGNPDWGLIAKDQAVANGAPSDSVEVYSPPRMDKSCNPSASPAYDTTHANEYIQVIIRTETASTLLGLIGVNSTETCVDTIARASNAEYVPPFGNAALIALSPHDNHAMNFNGGAKVEVENGSIFSNSDSGTSILLNGGAWFTSQSMQSVGTIYMNGGMNMESDMMAGVDFRANGGVRVTGSVTAGRNVGVMGGSMIGGDITAGGSYSCLGFCMVSGTIRENVPNVPTPQQINVPDDLPPVPAPPSAPSCSGDGSMERTSDGYIFHPGNFNDIVVNGCAVEKFEPGTYCIHGNFNLNGCNHLRNLSDGRVQFVIDNNVILNGGVDLDMDNVEIFTQNADWVLNGGAIMHTNRFRFYGLGTGKLIVNGMSHFTSDNAFLYFKQGQFIWNGGSYLNLTAPPEGDPYTGLMVYAPWENTNTFIFNGGQYVRTTGSFFLPHANIIFNGGSAVDVEHSQFIAYTMMFNGGSWLHIYYDSDENWRIPQEPVIELIH